MIDIIASYQEDNLENYIINEAQLLIEALEDVNSNRLLDGPAAMEALKKKYQF